NARSRGRILEGVCTCNIIAELYRSKVQRRSLMQKRPHWIHHIVVWKTDLSYDSSTTHDRNYFYQYRSKSTEVFKENMQSRLMKGAMVALLGLGLMGTPLFAADQ